MSKAAEGLTNAPYKQSRIKRFLLLPLGLLYRLWTRSIRITCENSDQVPSESPSREPVVIFLWHNRLFLAGEWHRRFRKPMTCYGLISGSKDGALLETFFGWSGIRAIRGSSNRRGVQAVRDSVRVMRNGHDVGITPDGSRGPRYEAKSGALLLAKLTKSPMLLVSFEFGWSVKLNSWDRFVIPLPFSKVILRTTTLSFDELFDGRDLEEATKLAESRLLQLTRD